MEPVTESQLQSLEIRIKTEITRLKTFFLVWLYVFFLIEVVIAAMVAAALKP